MSSNPPDRDSRFHQVLASYLEATESGLPPDRTALLARHPDLQVPLAEYFAAEDEVRSRAADLVSWRRTTSLTLGPYELLTEIGRGGMGVVYRARQRVPDRYVALKMIRPGLWVTAAEVERFRTEAGAAARLDHPNIVPIHEIGERDGHLFFSMKLCAGGSLASLAADGRPAQDLRHAVRLVVDVARAVHHAHQRGILHRDLKPSNILLDEAGRPHVADFGLAKVLNAASDLTAPGAILGTPGYLAPEMIPGPPSAKDGRQPVVTTAVDVYGLGAILYFLITGRPPFRGQTLAETLALVQAHDPVSPRHFNPTVDRDLAAVCLHSLEKDPAKRYSSAEKLAEDLERWLEGSPTRARPVGRLARAQRWVARNPVFAALIGLAVLSVGGGFAALAVSYRAVVAERETTLASQRETAEYAENLRTRVYAGDIRLAHGLWQRGELTEARALLDRYLPEGGKPDLRGWEWHYLDALLEAMPREVARFTWPGREGYHSAISPDGRLVATGWAAGMIHIWDIRTGKEVTHFRPRFADVNWLAFIAKGTQLVSAHEDGFIRINDARTGSLLEELKGHKGPVESFAIDREESRLVSGGKDGVLRIWDLPGRRLLHELASHRDNIEGVAISDDGQLAATASYDGTIQLWELPARGLPRQKWSCNTGDRNYCVAFSSDGSRVGVGRIDGSVVEISLATGAILARNTNSVGANRGVAYLPGDSSTLLAVGDDGRLRAWQTARNELLWALSAHRNTAWSVVCSPDGRFAVTNSSDHSAVVWELRRGPSHSLDRVSGGATYLQQQPNGLMMLSTPDNDWHGGERIWRIQFDGEKETKDWPAFTGAHAPATAMSHNGKLLAFARADNSIEVRERGTSAARHVIDRPSFEPSGFPWVRGSGVHALSFLPGDDRLAVVYQDGTLATASVEGRPPVYRRSEEKNDLPVGLATIPGHGLGVVLQPRFRLFDLAKDSWSEAECRVPSRIESFAISRIGDRAALGLGSGGIKMISLPPGGEEMNLFGHVRSIRALAFTPDGRTLATACKDGLVRLWHAETGQELFIIEDRRDRAITSLAFTEDGRFLIAGVAMRDGRTVTVHDPKRR